MDKVSPPLDELGIPEEPEGDEEDKEEEDGGLVEGHPPELRDPLPNGAAHLVVLPREGAAELPGHPRGALAPVEEPNLQCMTDSIEQSFLVKVEGQGEEEDEDERLPEATASR